MSFLLHKSQNHKPQALIPARVYLSLSLQKRSQLAKGAALLAPALAPLVGSCASYRCGAVLVASLSAALAFGFGTQRALALNAALSVVFAASAAWLGLAGAREVLAVSGASCAAVPSNWGAARCALPTILQLLVFAETVPTVSAQLEHEPRAVRSALVVGSLLPLLLEIGWAWLGLRLLALDPATRDPIDLLLSLRATKWPVRVLSASAITTTCLGTLLTSKQLLDDLLRNNATASTSSTSSWRHTALRRVGVPALALAPPLVVALTSPKAFFRAINFAGAYPVCILWGILPPLGLLALRRRESHKTPSIDQRAAETAGPTAWLCALFALSALFVGSTAFADATNLAAGLLVARARK